MMAIRLLAVLLCFAIIAPAAHAAAPQAQPAKKTLTFVADVWCPYNCEPDSDRPGYLVEILKTAFEKHGYTVEYIPVPWTRAIEEVTAGKYTGLIGTSQINTPDLIFPAVAQGAPAPSTFYRRIGDTWKYSDVASLDGKVFGVIADYLYDDDLNKYIIDNTANPKKVQVVAGDTALELNIRKLIGGRIDVTIEDPLVIAWFLSQNPDLQGKIESAGALDDGDDLPYVAFSPNDPQGAELAKILGDEMIVMRDNGDLQAIMARYGLIGF